MQCCTHCGQTIPPHRLPAKYCSKRCSNQFSKANRPYFTRYCQYCGQPWVTRETKSRFCSKRCGGRGTFVARRPRPSRQRGSYIYRGHNGQSELVHRLVWIAANGPIPRGYVIHHRNENSRDNRLENLELLTRAEHNSLHKTGRKFSAVHRQRLGASIRRWWQSRPRSLRVCIIEGCDRPHQAKSLCEMHYRAHWRKGRRRLCSIDGCARPHEAKGFCSTHYSRYWRSRRRRRVCTADSCAHLHYAKGFCRAHYFAHWRKVRINSAIPDASRS
jgi:HNH endonuclease